MLLQNARESGALYWISDFGNASGQGVQAIHVRLCPLSPSETDIPVRQDTKMAAGSVAVGGVMTARQHGQESTGLVQLPAGRASRRGATARAGLRIPALLLGLVASHAWAAGPFVPDVVSQFNALSVRADAIGFRLDLVPHVKASVDKCRHWQGVWRHQAADGTPYFFVTRSQNRPELNYGDEVDFAICGFATTGGGNIAIVRFDSRDKTGERLRSNRLVPRHSTQDSAPSILDQAVLSIDLDGTDGWPAYDHPGGMQAVDDVLAVAMEAPLADSGYPPVAIEFIDIRNPEHPVRLNPLVPQEPGVQAGLVGLTRLPSGRFLLVVTGKKNELLWFYESRATEADGSTDLRSPALGWNFLYEWSASIDGPSLGATWPTDPAHQTLNFLREGSIDGPLYLAGARGKYGPGDDLMDLYRVEILAGAVTLRHVSTKHKVAYASADGAVLNTGGANQASFAAANAFYVSPTGELLFYSTEHDNDGPFESVKAGEWRHIDMVRRDSPLLDPHALFLGPTSVPEGATIAVSAQGRQPVARAWMQFWEGENYTDRYVVMDYADRERDDFHDFKELDGIIDGFSDEARSWRWFAPIGCTMRANDDDFGDSNFPGEETRTLVGTGQVEFAPDLGSVRSDNGAHWMDEALTSAEFFDNCDQYYRAPVSVHWDMDLDGFHELEGYGVVFDARWLDGPSEAEVPLQAIHSVDGRAGTSIARIQVTNVAPGITRLHAVNTLGQQLGVDVPFVVVGLETVVDAEFLDQGRLDTHAALIAWGDGSTDEQDAFRVFSGATGGVTGRIVHAHRFAAPGIYQVELDVVDDDGGHDSGSLEVVVASLGAALEYALQELEALFGATTDARIRRLLDQARKAIGGNGGALSKLEAEQIVATLNELRRAAAALADANGAIDATAPLSIVALVAQSMAKQAYEVAVANAGPGSSEGARRQLAMALAAIGAGDAALSTLDYAGAIEQYRQSTAIVQNLKS